MKIGTGRVFGNAASTSASAGGPPVDATSANASSEPEMPLPASTGTLDERRRVVEHLTEGMAHRGGVVGDQPARLVRSHDARRRRATAVVISFIRRPLAHSRLLKKPSAPLDSTR